MSGPDQPGGATVYVEPEEPDVAPRLAHFPVTFFATVMGISGLSLAWMRAATVLGAPEPVGVVLFWLGVVLYAVVLGVYLTKILRHPAAVRAELTPAWFIPVVGMVVVPLAGVQVGPLEVSWFAFSVGLVFWGALLPMVLSRLFVHEQPVPAQLLPTLAVLIAPPSVAFLAWLKLTGEPLGLPTRVLYYAAAFFALLFVAQVGRLRRIPFFLSWWAYAFPLAGFSVATTVMARELGGTGWQVTAWALLAAVSALVLLLAVRTADAVARGRICVPE